MKSKHVIILYFGLTTSRPSSLKTFGLFSLINLFRFLQSDVQTCGVRGSIYITRVATAILAGYWCRLWKQARATVQINYKINQDQSGSRRTNHYGSSGGTDSRFCLYLDLLGFAACRCSRQSSLLSTMDGTLPNPLVSVVYTKVVRKLWFKCFNQGFCYKMWNIQINTFKRAQPISFDQDHIKESSE